MRPVIYWLVSGFLIFTGHRMMGGHVETMWQPQAFLMTFAPVICFFLYAYGVQGFFKFWNRLFTAKANETDFEIIDTATTLSFVFGGIACILGFAYAMENGGNNGVINAFYSVFYGALPTVLFMPFKHFKVYKGAKASHLRALGYSAATVAFAIVGYYMTKH